MSIPESDKAEFKETLMNNMKARLANTDQKFDHREMVKMYKDDAHELAQGRGSNWEKFLQSDAFSDMLKVISDQDKVDFQEKINNCNQIVDAVEPKLGNNPYAQEVFQKGST